MMAKSIFPGQYDEVILQKIVYKKKEYTSDDHRVISLFSVYPSDGNIVIMYEYIPFRNQMNTMLETKNCIINQNEYLVAIRDKRIKQILD